MSTRHRDVESKITPCAMPDADGLPCGRPGEPGLPLGICARHAAMVYRAVNRLAMERRSA